MPITSDRVLELSTTTGTGSMTLTGAVTNYRTFNTAFGTSSTVTIWYTIEMGTEWEVGIGKLTASTTLTRDTILSSSNSGSLVSFSAGTKNVFATAPADSINRIPPIMSNIRYVSTTGNDSNAQLGNINRPWASVRTAVDASSAGDTVCLLPGTHTPTPPLILKKNMLLTSYATNQLCW